MRVGDLTGFCFGDVEVYRLIFSDDSKIKDIEVQYAGQLSNAPEFVLNYSVNYISPLSDRKLGICVL